MNTKFIAILTAIILCNLPAHAERYSSSGEAFFIGAMQGLFITSIILIYNVIKRKKSRQKKDSNSETVNAIQNDKDNIIQDLTPWEKYRQSHTEIAKSVETMCNTNLNLLTAVDIDEKISSFQQLALKLDCPIPELKCNCIKKFTNQFTVEELPYVIESLLIKADKESKYKSIALHNTMCYQLHMWLQDYVYSKSK